jgi:hypothetical protein
MQISVCLLLCSSGAKIGIINQNKLENTFYNFKIPYPLNPNHLVLLMLN